MTMRTLEEIGDSVCGRLIGHGNELQQIIRAALREAVAQARRDVLAEPAEPSKERDAAVILAESLGYDVVKFPMVAQIMRQHIGEASKRAVAQERAACAEVARNACSCSCDEAYTSRGMVAPDCFKHQACDEAAAQIEDRDAREK